MNAFNHRSLAALAVAALTAATLVPMHARATTGSSTGTLSVTASVAQKCTVGDATLAFGSYDPVTTNLSANLDASTTITLTCTKGATGITLGFGGSPNAGTGCTAPVRCMKSGTSDYLSYQLYSDSGHSSVWTTAISETVTGGVTTPTSVTIYGRIPGGQDAAVGASYSDSITATINY